MFAVIYETSIIVYCSIFYMMKSECIQSNLNPYSSGTLNSTSFFAKNSYYKVPNSVCSNFKVYFCRQWWCSPCTFMALKCCCVTFIPMVTLLKFPWGVVCANLACVYHTTLPCVTGHMSNIVVQNKFFIANSDWSIGLIRKLVWQLVRCFSVNHSKFSTILFEFLCISLYQ